MVLLDKILDDSAVSRYLSIPPPHWIWAWTLGDAPRVSSSLLEPFAGAYVQISVQFRAGAFAVYEVAKASTYTSFTAV